MLKWARQHGCPWHEDLISEPDLDCCYLSAVNGHLDVLQWARENGCPWSEMTCANAAWGGQLQVLQ